MKCPQNQQKFRIKVIYKTPNTWRVSQRRCMSKGRRTSYGSRRPAEDEPSPEPAASSCDKNCSNFVVNQKEHGKLYRKKTSKMGII